MIIILILSLLLLIDAIYSVIRYCVAQKFIFNNKELNCSIIHDFVIIVPVLHEEKLIKSFLYNITKLDYPSKNFQIVFSTSEKELTKNNVPNTIDIIDDFIKKNPFVNISRIHCSDIVGNRITQLNFTITTLRKELDFDKKYYIFIDVDTEFDSQILKKINESILSDKIEYYQIPQNWFRDVDNRSFIMKGFAGLQTYLVFYSEVTRISELIFPWRGKYFVGNGMIIKGSLLNKINNFSDFIEDIRLGHISSFLNIKSQNTKNIVISTESAKKYRIMVNQTALWWFGSMLLHQDFIHAYNLGANITLKNIFKLFTLYYENLRWMLRNLSNIFFLILSFYIGDYNLFVINIASWIINSCIGTSLVVFNKNIVNLNTMQKIKIIISSTIIYPIYALGTFKGAGKLIKYIYTKKVNIYRTER
jgi:hypothetical protein